MASTSQAASTKNDGHEQELRRVPAEGEPRQHDAADDDAAGAVDVGVGEEPVGHRIGEGEGRECQVEIAQPDGGKGDEGADHRADGGRGEQAEQRASSGDLAHHERADSHEGELAEGDLARVAGDEHEGEPDDARGS